MTALPAAPHWFIGESPNVDVGPGGGLELNYTREFQEPNSRFAVVLVKCGSLARDGEWEVTDAEGVIIEAQPLHDEVVPFDEAERFAHAILRAVAAARTE